MDTRTLFAISISLQVDFSFLLLSRQKAITISMQKVNGDNWDSKKWDWKKEEQQEKKRENDAQILFAPSADRNRFEISRILSAHLLSDDLIVLEIGSGTGQHVELFAQENPHVTFLTSEMSQSGRASIEARTRALKNVRAPISINLLSLNDSLPLPQCNVLYACNIFHVSPKEVIKGMAELALRSESRKCVFYGPFKRGGKFTTESNERFDQMLRSSNEAFGLRDIESEIVPAFQCHGFGKIEIIEAACNNFILIISK